VIMRLLSLRHLYVGVAEGIALRYPTGVSEKCRCFCYAEPLRKKLFSCLDLPGLDLGPSGRVEGG